jgi:hypothetical protein
MLSIPRCPACGQMDQVAKVSTLYLEGIRRTRLRKQAGNKFGAGNALQLPAMYHALDTAALAQLSRRLKPPESGKTQLVRPVHPDLVVLVFSLSAPLFLKEIYTSQTSVFLPVLVILAVLYGSYFWKRKQFTAVFAEQQQARKMNEERIQSAIQSWMLLWYCPCEDIVFNPSDSSMIPVDQMIFHLLHGE